MVKMRELSKSLIFIVFSSSSAAHDSLIFSFESSFSTCCPSMVSRESLFLNTLHELI